MMLQDSEPGSYEIHAVIYPDTSVRHYNIKLRLKKYHVRSYPNTEIKAQNKIIVNY